MVRTGFFRVKHVSHDQKEAIAMPALLSNGWLTILFWLSLCVWLYALKQDPVAQFQPPISSMTPAGKAGSCSVPQ